MKQSIPSKIPPKPGPMGGRLIRKVVQELKITDFFGSNGVTTASHILIGCSGGPDSVALALLVARYGGRLRGQDSDIPIELVYFDHGWRPEKGPIEESWVRRFAEQLKVQFTTRSLPLPREGASWEAEAHHSRYSALEALRVERGPDTVILTGHHRDDQAETMLKRLLTGQAASQGGGILRQWGRVFRPLLGIKKAELLEFLAEEDQSFLLDDSNESLRFERNRVRHQLLPLIQEIFPRAVEHLAEMAEGAQANADRGLHPGGWVDLVRAAVPRPSQKILKEMNRAESALTEKQDRSRSFGSFNLPQGWVTGFRTLGKNRQISDLTLGELVPSLGESTADRPKRVLQYLMRVQPSIESDTDKEVR